jgi:hypothetical protein
MNSDDRFIQQLESYLDDYEGATILPERVRDEVRAALPRTKQTGAASGPVRYLSMTMNKFGPVALAAAAGLLAIAVGIYLFGGRNVGDTTPSPSMSAPSAAAVPCSETTVTPTGAGTTHEVFWCSARSSGENVPVAFTMEIPSELVDLSFYGDVESLWIRPERGGAILFAIDPERSVDELLADIQARDGYALSNEADATIDGAQGVVFDVTLAEGASSGTIEPLFETPSQPWLLSAGSVHRVWIVDHDGETFMIATGETLADAIGEALGTLTWSD